MQRVDSLEKPLMLGGIGGRRRRGWQRMRWLDAITESIDLSWVNSRSWWWTGRPVMLWFMGSQRVGQDWAFELNRTELREDLHFKELRIYNLNFLIKYSRKWRSGTYIWEEACLKFNHAKGIFKKALVMENGPFVLYNMEADIFTYPYILPTP